MGRDQHLWALLVCRWRTTATKSRESIEGPRPEVMARSAQKSHLFFHLFIIFFNHHVVTVSQSCLDHVQNKNKNNFFFMDTEEHKGTQP